MAKVKQLSLAVGVFAAIAAASATRAADHVDGPAASADPSADITDVFAWMSADASKVYLVMDLVRNASPSSKFSDSVQYVFHTRSSASFGGAAAPEIDVICTFDTAQVVQCWAGDDAYVTGDAGGIDGITSSDGKLRVFTGLRNDPFFFNLQGFRETARTVTAAAGGLTFDAAGCPAVDAATSAVLVDKLQHAPDGSAAVDNFADFNVLAIVVVVDKSILDGGGPIVAVSASTRRI